MFQPSQLFYRQFSSNTYIIEYKELLFLAENSFLFQCSIDLSYSATKKISRKGRKAPIVGANIKYGPCHVGHWVNKWFRIKSG